MAEENRVAEGEEPAGRKKGILENKVALLGLIVAVQAIMAVGLTQFVIVPRLGVQTAAVQNEPLTAEKTADLPPNMGVIVGLEEMVVTLQSKGSAPSYLRINVNLEVADQATADLVKARLPQLRDIVIVALSSKWASDLLTPEGKQSVRSEIFRRLAEKLPADKLENIYFSDLVIQ